MCVENAAVSAERENASGHFANPPSRSRLLLTERLGHAWRLRSVRGALLAMTDSSLRHVAPYWWTNRAPWYAGRAVESLHGSARVDRCVFELTEPAIGTFLKGLLWLNAYETFERYVVGRYLPRSLPVVEFGAAIGVVSCVVNRLLSEPRRHVCVEANPRLIPLLQSNRARNRCQFSIVHAALAYDGDSVSFGISDGIVDSSLDAASGCHRVAVPAVSLADILDQSGFDRCSVVCDVEGAEAALVAREGPVLRERVVALIMEVHPEKIGASGVVRLHQQLSSLGFSTAWRRGTVWVMRQGAASAGKTS
jgi:FkbM family methyltransferase